MYSDGQGFATAFKLESKLYGAIKPLLLVSQVFCAAPAGAHQFDPHTDLSEKWNRIIQLLHIAWCSTVYLCLSLCIYSEYTTFNVLLPTIQKTLYFTEYLVYLVHTLFIMVSCYMKRDTLRRFLQTIVSIDCKLLAFSVNPNYNAITRFYQIHLWLLVIFAVATAYVDYFYSGSKSTHFLSSLIAYLVPNFIIGISIIPYYALLYAIYIRCNSFARKLHSFKEEYEKDISELKEPHICLNRLRGIWFDLEGLTRRVNGEFSIVILLIYFGSFINMSINIFLVYEYFDQKAKINFAWTFYSIMWIVMHIGKIILILCHNHVIHLKKEGMVLALNSIQPHALAVEKIVTRTLLELRIVSRTHVICGLVELKMSLIRSILENVSVLVIFLVQYDVTFEALTNIYSTALASPI